MGSNKVLAGFNLKNRKNRSSTKRKQYLITIAENNYRMNFFLQNKPFIVPTTDGKLIEEHFGRASTKNENISVGHMFAPPGWSEPPQVPEFDEWTLVSRGKKCIEIDGNAMVVTAGQSILVNKGAKVRYSNPFQEECEYWSVCMPAFSVEIVHREE